MYQNCTGVNKVNKDLKMMAQSLSSENKKLKAQMITLEQRNEELTSTNKELAPLIE